MKLRYLLTACAVSLFALAGCGTTDAPVTGAENGATTSANTGSGPVSITDSRGKEVKLDQPATKVVTLEWSVTEIAQALGVNPVGVADPKGYGVWDTAVPLKGNPQDVGVRAEPSIDTIAGLEPDLILADTTSIPEDQMDQMERIAPVAVFKSASTDGVVDLVKDNQNKIGTLLGKEDAAQDLAKKYDDTIAKDKQTLADAGLAGTPVVYTYPYKDSNSYAFRMHGPGSAAGAVIQALGLANAWTEPGDEAYGISNSDVEGLSKLPDDTHMFYFNDKEEDRPDNALKDNKVYQGLSMVKNGHTYFTGDSVWMYGGTESLAQMADLYTETLTK